MRVYSQSHGKSHMPIHTTFPFLYGKKQRYFTIVQLLQKHPKNNKVQLGNYIITQGRKMLVLVSQIILGNQTLAKGILPKFPLIFI